MLREGTLRFEREIDLHVTYHDPCLLGRQSESYVPWQGEIKAFGLHEPAKTWRRGHDGVYDAPREVLRAIPGLRLTEMARHEENALCCGAGGGVGAANPELAHWTANERLDEAEATGATAIVSCCPQCHGNFAAVRSRREPALEVFDLTKLVAKAL
jgi:Fe-S oxidoreductase